MAVSGSPQFLITRLASFGFTYIIPLFSAFVIGVLELISISRIPYDYYWITNCQKKQSDYKWSVKLIVGFQFACTTILPFCTIITLLLFSVWTCEGNGIKIHREEFTVEPYWTEKLEEWKQVPIRMRIIKGKKVEKFVHDIKSLIFTFCILLQTLVVIFIKFCCVVSFYVIWLPLLFLVTLLCKLLSPVHKVSNDQMREEIELSQQFVILLEGDEQLPKSLLRNIVGGLNKYIKGGKNRQPRSLLNLLKQSFFYKGAIQFDNSQVPSLLTEEPPNCWTFPVMTLTAIAVALPSIANQHVDELISSVDEGLQYASHIDILDGNRALKYTKNAASVVWVGVKLHKKWLDMDLGDTIREVHSSKEIIQGLADEAERIVKEFGSTGSKSLVENPLYWPPNVLAANSMYRISRTILLYYENATLFGEIEDILKFFEERQLWGIGPSQPLYIDEWLRWMESETQDPTALTSATNNGTSPTVESNDSNDELVIVPM
ncbi:uncharacterized protein LOC116029918 [Ipomoea triloba]|uniref:uncharacterized protein LOC116029918 n=1 Tax=Ipomoea triloba TaxID=35885 RepID=UPI00125E566B|nr:uncharacterized protein LOC116029918 [Ipomoea triloba]